MFGRRPLRARGFRRLMRAGGLLGVRPRRMLNQAHALMAAGQYREAAQLFAELSDGAAERGMIDRAGNLLLEAGRAFLESGDTEQALVRVCQGLRFLMQAGREPRAAHALQMALAALKARSLNAEADALQKEFAALVGTAEAAPAPRGHLPTKCPNCGGPLRADDADWIDEQTAECPYCGSPVRAE